MEINIKSLSGEFMLLITRQWVTILRSQFATSSKGLASK